jgi:CMP-N,N'-diacetyllegionaminic acid synthase
MLVNQRPILALIPARGGSKGLKRKNMYPVNNIPLVGYSLKAALDSKYIDKVYLTSDDEITLLYGKEMGAKPILRPEELSSDTASASSVVEHFFNFLPHDLLKQDPFVVYLQPTSPLRTSIHIDSALVKMIEQRHTKLVSVVQMSKTPFKSFLLNKHGTLQSLFNEEMTNQRRQDLPTVYTANGAIYIFCWSDFKQHKIFPSNDSYPYIMSEQDSLDIDTKEDLLLFKELIDFNQKE